MMIFFSARARFVAVLMTTLFFAGAVLAAPAAEGLQQARRFFEAGRYAEARAAFSAVQNSWPTSPEAGVAAYYRGLSEERLGDRQAALTAYREMLTRYGASSELTPFARQRVREVEAELKNIAPAQVVPATANGAPAGASPGALDRLAQGIIEELSTRAVPPREGVGGARGSRAAVSRGSAAVRATPTGRTASATPAFPRDPESSLWPKVSSAPEASSVFPDLRLVPSDETPVDGAPYQTLRVVAFPTLSPEVSSERPAVASERPIEPVPMIRPVSPDVSVQAAPSRKPPVEPLVAPAGFSVAYVRRPTAGSLGYRPVSLDAPAPSSPALELNAATPVVAPVSEPLPIARRLSPSAGIFGLNEPPRIDESAAAGPLARSAPMTIPGIVISAPVISILRSDLFAPGPQETLPEPEIKPEPVVEVEPEIKPEPVVEVEPEIKPEPVVEVEPEIKPEPIVEPRVDVIPLKPQSLQMDWTPLPPSGLATSPVVTSPQGNEPMSPFGVAPAISTPVLPSVDIGASSLSQPMASGVALDEPSSAVSIQIPIPTPILPALSITPPAVTPPSAESAGRPTPLSSSQSTAMPSVEPAQPGAPAAAATLPPPQYTISLDLVRRSLSNEAVGLGAGAPTVLRPAGPVAPAQPASPSVSSLAPSQPGAPAQSVVGYQSVAEPHIQRALGFRRLGLNEKAIQEYRRAIEADPRNPIARNNLADLLIEEGEHLQEAVDLVVEAIQMDVADPGPYYSTLGWAYARLGEYQNAERFLNDALKAGMTAERLYRRGRLYAAMGMAARARADYDRALVYSEDAALSEMIRSAMNDVSSEIPGQGAAVIIR